MNVLVVGGSGFVGTYLSAELNDRGHEVTVLSRHPDEDVGDDGGSDDGGSDDGGGDDGGDGTSDRDAPSMPDGVDTYAGDVTDYDSIEGAFAGQDAVVYLVALTPLFRPDGGNEMHDRVHRGGTENCLRAAEEHGVDRYVQQSALAADPNANTHYLRAKGRADELVRESDLDWTVFRPSIIFGDGGEFVSFTKRLKSWFAPGLPIYPLPGGGRHARFQPIWVREFVPLLADALADDDHVGETYQIGGPEVFTLHEVTEMVFAADGRSIRIVPLPMPLAKVGLGLMGRLGLPLGSDQFQGLRFDNTVDHNDAAAFGVDEGDLRTFPSYLGVD